MIAGTFYLRHNHVKGRDKPFACTGFENRQSRSLTLGSFGQIELQAPDRDYSQLDTDSFNIVCFGNPYIMEAEGPLSGARAVAQAMTSPVDFEKTAWPRRLFGEFAIIIFHKETRRLILVTDRFARYPLYYSETADGVLRFGSYPSTLMIADDMADAISHQAIYDYLFFTAVPGPQSFIRGITKLEPSTILEANTDGVRTHHYFEPAFQERLRYSFNNARADLFRVLRHAVARAAGSGPAGCFLSGGLDSSTIAGLLAASGQLTHAYTIGFDQPGYDETGFARIIAKHFGISLREYYLTPEDMIEALPKVASQYPEPFGNASAIPAYICAMKAAEDGTQVLLAGDGGDELFGGNERYSRQLLFQFYHSIPQPIRNLCLEPLARRSRFGEKSGAIDKLSSYISQASVRLPDRLHTYNLLTRTAANEIFEDAFLAMIDTGHPFAIQRQHYENTRANSTTNRLLNLDWKFTLTDNDLVKVTNACDMAGILVRFPFLDTPVVDFSCQLRPNDKAGLRRLRPFYRKAMKGFLPPETLKKSKHGFGLPFGQWMVQNKNVGCFVSEKLQKIAQRRLFRTQYLKHLETVVLPDNPGFAGQLIWPILTLEIWLEAHAPGWECR